MIINCEKEISAMKKLIGQYGERYSIATIYTLFTVVSLGVAVVLFGVLHSTGIMKFAFANTIKEAEFGGAFTGFLATLIFLVKSYNQSTRSVKLAITGNVLSDNGSPIKSAFVFVEGVDRKKETDSTGWFQIEVDERKSWVVRASYNDHNEQKAVKRNDIRKPITIILKNTILIENEKADLGIAESGKLRIKQPLHEIRSDSPLPYRLLSLIWNYPLVGGNHTSWAVKESAVLKGELKSASQRPGLGIAIFSTELALKAFGNDAESRIDGCLKWGLSRTQSESPFLMLVEGTEPITSKTEVKTDFRHTLALSIILARTRKHINHLKHYLQLTLDLQRDDDGGWPPGEGITVSEVFTVFYAAEFLTLCNLIEDIPKEMRRKAVLARDKGIDWLINDADQNKLWKSGVLDYPWDSLLSTAWVLRRLVHFKEITSELWLYH